MRWNMPPNEMLCNANVRLSEICPLNFQIKSKKTKNLSKKTKDDNERKETKKMTNKKASSTKHLLFSDAPMK